MSSAVDEDGGGRQAWTGRRAELGTLLTYATATVPHTQLYQRIMDAFVEGVAAYQLRTAAVHLEEKHLVADLIKDLRAEGTG